MKAFHPLKNIAHIRNLTPTGGHPSHRCNIDRHSSQVESLGAFANALREQNLEVFKKLDHLTALNRVQKRKVVMKKGELPCERALCLLCGAKKHHVKWMCKDGHCTGGTCYACFRASIVLDVSRSPTLITESGASGVELRGSLRP